MFTSRRNNQGHAAARKWLVPLVTAGFMTALAVASYTSRPAGAYSSSLSAAKKSQIVSFTKDFNAPLQISGGSYAIQTRNGRFLSAVRCGGIKKAGAIHTDASKVGAWEIFTLEERSGGKYAIKTCGGTYLTAVNGGGVRVADAIHTDSKQAQAWEEFRLRDLGNGYYAIQTVNGNYLTAMRGGGGSGDDAIHTDAREVKDWEMFKFIGVSAGSMSGNWWAYAGGNELTRSASISQSGSSLTLDNGGSKAAGRFEGANVIVVEAWGVRGTVSDNGRRIDWSNGTYWVKH